MLFTPTYVIIYVEQGCTNPGRQDARATEFCTVAPPYRLVLSMKLVSFHGSNA